MKNLICDRAKDCLNVDCFHRTIHVPDFRHYCGKDTCFNVVGPVKCINVRKVKLDRIKELTQDEGRR